MLNDLTLTGVWKDREELASLRNSNPTVFKPRQKFSHYKALFDEWERAMKRSLNWYVKLLFFIRSLHQKSLNYVFILNIIF